jgi:hypothetical protein
MSLSRIVAMMAGQGFATFVGSASHNETSTGVPIPAAAQVGDFCVVIYYTSRTISGGSGAVWTTDTSVSQTKVSYRQLLADDLTVPIVQDNVGPVLVFVFRGPSIIAPIDVETYSGSVLAYGGFTTTKTEQAVLFIGYGADDTISPRDGFPTQFSQSQYTGGFSWSAYGFLAGAYVDGTPFDVRNDLNNTHTGSKAFGIYELRAY